MPVCCFICFRTSAPVGLHVCLVRFTSLFLSPPSKDWKEYILRGCAQHRWQLQMQGPCYKRIYKHLLMCTVLCVGDSFVIKIKRILHVVPNNLSASSVLFWCLLLNGILSWNTGPCQNRQSSCAVSYLATFDTSCLAIVGKIAKVSLLAKKLTGQIAAMKQLQLITLV